MFIVMSIQTSSSNIYPVNSTSSKNTIQSTSKSLSSWAKQYCNNTGTIQKNLRSDFNLLRLYDRENKTKINIMLLVIITISLCCLITAYFYKN